MKDRILIELQASSYTTSYELTNKIPNSPTGIKRYLEELVAEGKIRFVQRIRHNRLINYYYVPAYSTIEIQRFTIPTEFVDFLQWQTSQKIFLHMVTAQSFHLTTAKETSFFTFASLEFTLQFDKDINEYYIILPENFLFFYQINSSKTDCFSIVEDKTTLMYVIPQEEFTLLPNPPRKSELEKGATI